MYMSALMARTRPRYWQHSIILPCYIYMSAWMIRTGCRYCDDGSFLADEDCWKGWWSVLAYSLMAVETDSWCAPSTALWTVLGCMNMSVHLDIDSTAKRLLFHSPIQIASTEILYRNFFFIAHRVLKWLFPNPERLPFFLKTNKYNCVDYTAQCLLFELYGEIDWDSLHYSDSKDKNLFITHMI